MRECPLNQRSKCVCIQEGCAWWETIIGECSIKSLARYMRRSDARQEEAKTK